MHLHLPRSVAKTLADRCVLEHRVIEADDELVLMVKTRSRGARKLRKRLETELSQSGTSATVVLNSSARQELDMSKWGLAKPPSLRCVEPPRSGSYLLA